MGHADRLARLMADDPVSWRLLGMVRDLRLPDGWIGAGFVRNAVWDHLHGRPPAAPTGDVDVVWFGCGTEAADRRLEAALRSAEPTVAWSVKDQKRMHGRNGDPAYRSTADAIRHWPETATAVAVRRTAADRVEVCAPFGLDDLFAPVLRPTPRFAGDRAVCESRASAKGWCATWPLLRWAHDGGGVPRRTPPYDDAGRPRNHAPARTATPTSTP